MERIRSVGVRDVVWFNYPTYLVGLLVVVAGLSVLSAHIVPAPLDIVVLIGVAVAAWWVLASVVASFWVFDGSGVTRWRWLPEALGGMPTSWTNITSGFDDTTESLRAALPGTTGIAVDVFDGRSRHDGPLRRARTRFPPRGSSVPPDQPLPVPDESQDAVFMLMSAHELDPTAATTLVFSEAARSLRAGGRVVVVEFVGTSRSASVFGPGALHFEGPAVWRGAAGGAGLTRVSERRLTPFVAAFVFEKAGSPEALDRS